VKKRRLLLLLSAAPFASTAMGQSKRGRREAAPVPALEVTLHEFQEDLKLTAGQEALFEAYAKKVRALAADINRKRERQRNVGFAKENVLARIEHALDVRRDHLTALEDIADAAKALYAKFDDGQRLAADPRLATVMLMPLGGLGPA
jgi:hypothetical protein